MRSMTASGESVSRTLVGQNRAHGGRDARPLLALGGSAAAPLRGQAVVLAPAAGIAVAPGRLEQAGALHLMERRVQRSFLELKRAGAPAFGFLQDLVAVHRALGEQAENQHPDGARQEFAIVVHAHPCRARYHTLLNKAKGFGDCGLRIADWGLLRIAGLRIADCGWLITSRHRR